MSNFVAKIIPFLPTSMQFEELNEAASAFNRFSERLTSCRTYHEEKVVVRSEWENARKQLMMCRDGDTVLIFDYMSILLYITSVDHWALSDTEKAAFDPVPVIGRLLHSDELRSRKFGALAATMSSDEERGLLLANTISKMLDSSQTRTAEMALRVASHLMSPSLVPLFSKGIQRALRSRSPSVRKVAWIAYSDLVKADDHAMLDPEILRSLTMTEADVDGLCAISRFFEEHENTKVVAKYWIEHVQKALIQKPFAVLQCRLLRLMRSLTLGTIENLKSILRIDFRDGQQAVHLELLKTLQGVQDDFDLSELVELPRRYFSDPVPGLLMLKELSRHSVKTVLQYQEQLVSALDNEDPEVRLLALRVLENAANSENWRLLLDNCTRIVEMCAPIESETVVQAAKIGTKLVCMFEEPSKILESVLGLLDELPESISEEHLDRIVQVIKLGSKCALSFLTRAYVFENQHSLLHDLYLIHLASLEGPLDPNFGARLLVGFLDRACQRGSDHVFVREILRTMVWLVSRGINVDLANFTLIEKYLDKANAWLIKLVTTGDKGMIKQFVDADGDVDSIVADIILDFDERLRLFEEHFAENEKEPIIDIIDNRSTESFTQGIEAEELRVFPSIGELPTFPESEPEPLEAPLALQITSDLFKGLL